MASSKKILWYYYLLTHTWIASRAALVGSNFRVFYGWKDWHSHLYCLLLTLGYFFFGCLYFYNPLSTWWDFVLVGWYSLPREKVPCMWVVPRWWFVSPFSHFIFLFFFSHYFMCFPLFISICLSHHLDCDAINLRTFQSHRQQDRQPVASTCRTRAETRFSVRLDVVVKKRINFGQSYKKKQKVFRKSVSELHG